MTVSANHFWRFTVKSPKSHVARFYFAWNKSNVTWKLSLSRPKSTSYYTFTALVSSHQGLKNESLSSTFTVFVTSHNRLKNEIYYTHCFAQLYFSLCHTQDEISDDITIINFEQSNFGFGRHNFRRDNFLFWATWPVTFLHFVHFVLDHQSSDLNPNDTKPK